MPLPVHVPVLPREVLTLLMPRPGDTVCDATVGLGGHARLLLDAIGPDGTLVALDADADNLALARMRLGDLPNVRWVHANFRDIAKLGLPPLRVILADLGVSSAHLDLPERGFSFRSDGPLDLRLNRSAGVPAAEWIAREGEAGIARALRDFGEIRGAYSVARAIAEEQPETTLALRSCVERAMGWRAPAFLPRVFQALRMAVNDELGALADFLRDAPQLLVPGGRMGIMAFHSLEDGMVKRAFRSLCTPERDAGTGREVSPAEFLALTKKPIVPSREEISANPRARSAKLRGIARRGEV